MGLISKLDRLDEKIGLTPRHTFGRKTLRRWWIWYALGFTALIVGLILQTLWGWSPFYYVLIIWGAFGLYASGYLRGQWEVMKAGFIEEGIRVSERRDPGLYQ